MKLIQCFILAGLILALSSCTTPSTPAPGATAQSENPLDGTHWKLVAFKNRLVMEKQPIDLHFEQDKLRGEMGCNQYDATYTADQAQIKVDTFAITVQLCEDEAVMDQETRYLDAWRGAAMSQPADFRLKQDGASSTLEILDAEGEPVLIFESAENQP